MCINWRSMKIYQSARVCSFFFLKTLMCHKHKWMQKQYLFSNSYNHLFLVQGGSMSKQDSYNENIYICRKEKPKITHQGSLVVQTSSLGPSKTRRSCVQLMLVTLWLTWYPIAHGWLQVSGGHPASGSKVALLWRGSLKKERSKIFFVHP